MEYIKFGVELSQNMGFDYVKETALAMEELGYDSVWVRDHVTISPAEMARFPQGVIENNQRVVRGDYLGCIPTLSALAAVTNRITIGTDILNIPRRNPVDIANEIASVDQISRGRVILQGAIGQPERDWASSGVRYPLAERGKMMEEAIDIIRALWTHDEPYTFKGKYYDIEEARIGARVVQIPHPPIWLGVGTTFKRVAKYAEGFTLTSSMWGESIEHYRDSLKKIHAAAVAIGRDPSEIEATARFGMVMGSDDAKAKARAVDHWGKLFMKPAPWYEQWAGNAETISAIIQQWVDAGARHIMIWPIPYASPAERLNDIEYFARNVIPRFR